MENTERKTRKKRALYPAVTLSFRVRTRDEMEIKELVRSVLISKGYKLNEKQPGREVSV